MKKVITVNVEDSARILNILRSYLGKDPVDLMLVGINLLDENGIEVVRKFGESYDTKLIYLTKDRKNYSQMKRFILKKSISTRMELPTQMQYKVNNLVLDMKDQCVYKDGQPLHLFTKEKRILFYLFENRNSIRNAEQITNYIWGYNEEMDLKAVKVYISKLRKKIEMNPAKPEIIQTVHGFGYKFCVE